MLSERSRTTTPTVSCGMRARSVVCGSRADAAAASTTASAPHARLARTILVRLTTLRNAATSCVSTPFARRRRASNRSLMDTAVPVLAQVDGRPHAGREAARLLDDRIVLGPRQRAGGTCELRVLDVEDLGDEL